jgi:hypothetical protein
MSMAGRELDRGALFDRIEYRSDSDFRRENGLDRPQMSCARNGANQFGSPVLWAQQLSRRIASHLSVVSTEEPFPIFDDFVNGLFHSVSVKRPFMYI